MRRIYLIDCPGIVPPNQHDTPQDLLLRGVVRVENVDNPEQYIPAVLKKVKLHHMERTYELKGWKDHIEFLELLARKGGRLLKGGEPDVDGVAKMVLNDFMRGKIPWFTPAPAMEGEEDDTVVEGRGGRFGEMPLKRKRDEAEDVTDTPATVTVPTEEAGDDEEGGNEDFAGFSSDSDSEQGDAEEAVETSGSAEDMIPLDDTSDEEDEQEDEEDSESENDVNDAESSDIEIEGASELVDSDEDEASPVQKRRRKGR